MTENEKKLLILMARCLWQTMNNVLALHMKADPTFKGEGYAARMKELQTLAEEVKGESANADI